MSEDQALADPAAATDGGDASNGSTGSSNDGPAAPVFYLNATTRAEGVLFKVEEKVENGPDMTGTLTIDGKTFPLSVFVETARETSTKYGMVNVGTKDGVRYHGRLFRSTSDYPTSPSHTGFITVLPVHDGKKYDQATWDESPTLRLVGYERRNNSGGARIVLTLSPSEVQPGELPL